MAKKQDKPIEKIEREYVIPLRTYFKRVPRYKRANRTIKGIKEFLARHMKVRDRDLKKIKLDSYINEQVWARGIKKPPVKIKVKAVKEGDIVRAELVELPTKLKFKKLRELKVQKEALEAKEKKKTMMERAKEGMQKPKENPEGKKSEEAEKKEEEKDNLKVTRVEEKEKKSAVVEAGKKMEKAAAKQTKHMAGGKTKQLKHKQRKALAK